MEKALKEIKILIKTFLLENGGKEKGENTYIIGEIFSNENIYHSELKWGGIYNYKDNN